MKNDCSGSNAHMKRNLFPVPLVLWTAIAFVALALCQDQAPKVKIREAPAKQTNEVSGAKLFHTYCAACHGQDGRGNGPAAPALKTAPTDLTLLAQHNGGNFPAEHVIHVLISDSEPLAHGSKNMPMWGPIFRQMGAHQSLARLRAHNVMEYLKSIQAK
jgi:mono/diheme cytochrome c family protein